MTFFQISAVLISFDRFVQQRELTLHLAPSDNRIEVDFQLSLALLEEFVKTT